MNVVDSSGWLEYFTDGPNAEFFAIPLALPDALIVPTISMYEVFKTILRQTGESEALEAVALMGRSQVIVLDPAVSLEAARLSLELSLPMADAVILATARLHDAVLWTQDVDFEGVEGVQYRPKHAD